MSGKQSVQDPTADEMRAFLATRLYGEDPAENEFEIEAAIYWFASDWHGGQSSNLYSALSTSPYRPGPCTSGLEKESMEEMLYQSLEMEYAGVCHE